MGAPKPPPCLRAAIRSDVLETAAAAVTSRMSLPTRRPCQYTRVRHLFHHPSHAFRSSHGAWQVRPPTDGGPSVLDRLKKLKTLVVEPRDGAELAAAINSYEGAVKSSTLHGTGGGLLLAVCRGKLSEGDCSLSAS